MGTETALKQTPLFETYGKYGAKVIDFGGWALPVQFSSILEEHEAVRTEAGLFDVSHMGEVLVEGKDAESLYQLPCNKRCNETRDQSSTVYRNVLSRRRNGR